MTQTTAFIKISHIEIREIETKKEKSARRERAELREREIRKETKKERRERKISRPSPCGGLEIGEFVEIIKKIEDKIEKTCGEKKKEEEERKPVSQQKFLGKCFACGKIGHRRTECRSLLNNQNNRPYQSYNFKKGPYIDSRSNYQNRWPNSSIYTYYTQPSQTPQILGTPAVPRIEYRQESTQVPVASTYNSVTNDLITTLKDSIDRRDKEQARKEKAAQIR